jgi:UDP-N-acetylmuramyl pentapeptide phosphotransferase/UDP-N-acetylglucosamine-1-phosphate transferase
MPQVLASLATSFLVTFFAIPVIIKISKKRGLFDQPGRRKIHTRETPSMGGIAIFAGLFTAIAMWITLQGLLVYNYFFSALIIIFITGIRDDLVPLKPSYKLLAQIVAASMIVFFTDIKLDSLYGLFGIYDLPEPLLATINIFTIIVITNSFNLIDGLDGLAGSIALIAFLFFGCWFYLMGDKYMSIIIFSLIGAIIAFLNFNWEPSRIFMGDTGALLLGFMLAVISIYFIDVNYNLPADSPLKFQPSIATAVAVLIIPLFDTLRITISRMMRGRSPFSPDKTHIHHLLMRIGLNHSQTAGVMALVNLTFIGVVFLGRDLNDNIMVPLVISFALFYSLILDFLIAWRFPKKASNFKKIGSKVNLF